jgi:tetratricopeptide (TPR) repeat protein
MHVPLVLAIAVAALAVAAAVAAFLSSASLRRARTERETCEREIARLTGDLASSRTVAGAAEAGTEALAARLVRESTRADLLDERIASLEQELEDLRSASERSKTEQTSQRRFFGRKARETFDLIRQRLAAEGFPDRVEALADGGPRPLSDDTRRLLKELDGWMEQGSVEETDILHTLALLDFNRGDARRAELRLKAATRVSNDPLLWENLGDLTALAGRPRRAVEAYRTAARSAPEGSPVHRKLGMALYRMRDYAGAVRPLATAAKGRPDDLDLHVRYARALVEAGELGRAVELVHDASPRFPGSPLLQACAVTAFARMGRFSDAEAAFESAMQIDPRSPEVHVARGLAWLHESDPAKAAGSFLHASELDPARARAHWGLGEAANREQEYEKALVHLRRAVELQPDDAESWYAMKTAYEGLKQFEAAVEALNKAVALDQKSG